MRRLLIALLVIVATAPWWFAVPSAGAARQPGVTYTDLGWWLTASPVHVAHCTRGVAWWNANQRTCRIVWPDQSSTYVADMFVRPGCELVVQSGDAAGTPLYLRWRSTDPWQACAPGDGVDVTYLDPAWAAAWEGYEFPRSAGWAWARNAIVGVW